ncbi:hypothetical protein MMC28_004769 [Mycoblastus sanguinarius]|nr:hypothetical protein [Mycoblastus sanguinarius]
MLNLRAASRVSRNLPLRLANRQLRHESTTTSSSSSFSPSLIGGLAGGGLVLFGGYGWYHFSGAKTLVNTAKQTEATFKAYGKKLRDSTPEFEPNAALEWLRSTAKSYAAIIPGSKGYIDSAFDDIDAVRHKHGKEVDSMIKTAYDELKEISQEGMSLSSASKAWDILQRHSRRIADLAGDAGQELIDNHPALKDKVGGNLDQLKQMGDKYGPEAKKQVDEIWEQIRGVVKSGVSAESIPKIHSLVQEKMQKMQELGGKLWEQGMEKAKPYLDKSPEAKEVIEKNAEQLKQGNIQELSEKIKEGVQSGNMDSLKSYVQTTVDKVKQRGGQGGGLENYLKMIPGGNEIIPKLTQMQQIAQQHGEEAEKIAKDTFQEIEEVLRRRVGEAQELAEKAEKKAKSG